MTLRLFTIATVMLMLSACAELHTKFLAIDALNGRNNNTSESIEAQNYLIGFLQSRGIAGLNAGSGDAAYKQAFPLGTNILGVIPGADLADEYVVIGAHYDHITNCAIAAPGDTICNGATDNAAGVAAALDIGLYYTVQGNVPRRSIVIALWDREEDGLLGSDYYVDNPLVPLADTVAYINFDILGANLLPSLRDISIAVGAETGGAAFVNAVQVAAATEPLDVKQFSSIFGQNRSDYANFIGAGVPTVFFTDSTGPCYHTSGDDHTVVDFGKLNEQVRISLVLAKELASGQLTPAFDAAAPLATYEDAVTLNDLIQLSLADIGRFTPSQQASISGWATTIAAFVSDGPGEFSAGDVVTMLGIAAQLVSLLTTGECDGFLED